MALAPFHRSVGKERLRQPVTTRILLNEASTLERQHAARGYVVVGQRDRDNSLHSSSPRLTETDLQNYYKIVLKSG